MLPPASVILRTLPLPLLACLTWVSALSAQSSAAPPHTFTEAQAWLAASVARGSVELIVPSAEPLLGATYDPFKLIGRRALVVELYAGSSGDDGMWLARLGTQPVVGLSPVESVNPPSLRDGRLFIDGDADNGPFQACTDRGAPARARRRLMVAPRRDGAFDVTLCGTTTRLVVSTGIGTRFTRWRTDLTDRLIGTAAAGDPTLTRDAAGSWRWHGNASNGPCTLAFVDCRQDRPAVSCSFVDGGVLRVDMASDGVRVTRDANFHSMLEETTTIAGMPCVKPHPAP